jgi:hypothetical protein
MKRGIREGGEVISCVIMDWGREQATGFSERGRSVEELRLSGWG